MHAVTQPEEDLPLHLFPSQEGEQVNYPLPHNTFPLAVSFCRHT